jgi:hypothetical protein
MSIGTFLLLLAAVGVLFMSMPADCTPIQARSSSAYNTSTCWLGYEFDSSLGYPGEGPPGLNEPPIEVEKDAMDVWLLELEKVKLSIEALPFVQKVEFFCDDHDQNLNKVLATLWCCWDSSGSRFKRVFEACDKTGKKPSHLEAARALHANLVKKHGRADHVFDHRAVTRREQRTREHSQQSAEAEAATAFNRIGLAQARQQAAARDASAAEKAAEVAQQAEIAARLAREEAVLQAKALRAAADALKPKEPSHKKQKTAFAAGSSSQEQVQQTDVCEPALDDDAESTYTTWTPAKWKELETKEQQRRKTPIDPARTRTHTHAHAHARACTRTHAHARARTPKKQIWCAKCLFVCRSQSVCRSRTVPARWTAQQIVQNGWKEDPQFSPAAQKSPQNFRLRRRFPPPKSRLHIHWTPPTRADAMSGIAYM